MRRWPFRSRVQIYPMKSNVSDLETRTSLNNLFGDTKMKKTIASIIAILAVGVYAADKYVFSADGKRAATSPRMLPDVGRDFSAGAVVSNLQEQTASVLAGCGWYRVIVPEVELGMLQYVVTNGYKFDSTNGTATAMIEVRDGAPVKKYTQYRVIGMLMQIGKWEEVKAFLVEKNLYDLFIGAQYLATDDPVFFGAVKEMAKLLGLSQQEMDALLEKCLDD